MDCTLFSIFYENKKRMRALKIQSKNLLLGENSSQLFELRFLIYQKHEMALWVHGFW